MKNFNNQIIIGLKDGIKKRGAYVIAQRFANENNLNFVEFYKRNKINFNNYKKIIFTYQKIRDYDFIKKTIRDEKFLFYLRNLDEAKLFNSASNGFSYYCEGKSHKNFIPYVCDYPFKINSLPNELTFGFYTRPEIITDSYQFFINFLKTSKQKINLVTFGDLCCEIANIPSINSWKHTFSTEEFFNSITHYIYPFSSERKDPFPNSLMEAIQTNKQIICPKINNSRNHKDGIDDLLSLLSNGYHTSLENLAGEYLNPNHGLTYKNFKKFNLKIFNSEWNNFLEYDKYKSFYDWCSHEL